MRVDFSKLFADKHSTLSQLFQIAVALWFFRMIVPGVIYVFLPVLLFLLIFGLFYQGRNIFQKAYIYEFLKTFNPLIILGLFFIGALFIARPIQNRPIRDLFEYFVNLFFLIIFFTLTYRARQKAGFIFVFNKMTRIIWISALVVSIIGLLKYGLQLLNYNIPGQMQYGTTLNQDKNFFALYAALGIIGLLPRLSKADHFATRFASQLILLILMLNILFAYSYRSPLLLGILAVSLLIVQFIGISNANEMVRNLAKNLRFFTITYLAIIAFIGINQYQTELPNESIFSRYYHQISLNNETHHTEQLSSKTFHFDKWQYAIDLFNDRPTNQKIFGNGFSYLGDFGKHFNGNELNVDYPHNPVLSGLLYSGIFGAVFILFFILIALYYAGKYFQKYPLYSLMLYTSMLFILFSGNSLFSVPIFLFLFSLSFMIRHQEISELNIVMNLQKPGAKFLKETFDYILASLSLVILSPLLLFISVFITITMGWPVVYSQVRIGQNGKPFRLHKFRSMKKAKTNITVAAGELNRITRFGKLMRKYKLDELPELWNIIRGDMSFVGPRPDVPGYADELKGDDRVILQLKPGLTGAASLKYMHEEELLAKQSDPVKYNDEIIFPDKVLVNKKYMEKWTLWLDLKIIFLTAIGRSSHEDSFL